MCNLWYLWVGRYIPSGCQLFIFIQKAVLTWTVDPANKKFSYHKWENSLALFASPSTAPPPFSLLYSNNSIWYTALCMSFYNIWWSELRSTKAYAIYRYSIYVLALCLPVCLSSDLVSLYSANLPCHSLKYHKLLSKYHLESSWFPIYPNNLIFSDH